MAVASDFSSHELSWLAMIERRADVLPPAAVQLRLIETRLADSTGGGIAITGIGGEVLQQARDLGLLPVASAGAALWR